MKRVGKVMHLIFCLISLFCKFCCCILALRFSMKDVMLLCLMGVHVDKKNINFFFDLGVDIYNFFVCTWSMKTNKNL
jgi:hypothetical protein